MQNQKYKICSKCVMDTIANQEISFDKNGICNYCINYETNIGVRVGNDRKSLLKVFNQIKEKGKKNEYDCIIGVSGGVDSTYIAYLCKQNGLNPLAIHFDNGWNSELAVSNIEKTLKKLDIDLFTYVIDWEEFKDLQLAFLKSSTPDSEIPTDHAIYALLLREANKRKIKYIITGMNYQTESIMPTTWAYGHSDWKYIKSIHKKFAKNKLKTFPHYSFFYLFYTLFVKRIKMISLLNYFKYDKNEAMKILQEKLDWKYYGGKHYESIYTRFFQSYILPNKFKIDKRKAHFSNLINSGQMTRKEAIEELKNKTYPTNLLKQDKDFVIKKLGLDEKGFTTLMQLPIKSYKDYKSNHKTITVLKRLYTFFRKVNILPK